MTTGLQPYLSNPLVVDVCDRTVGNTTYRQRAHLVGDQFYYDKDKQPCIDLHLEVFMYNRLEDGGYGVRLDQPGFVARPFTLKGRNDTLVVAGDPEAPEFGNMLAQRRFLADGVTPDPQQDWQAVLDHFAHLPLMLQGNFYEHVAEKVPLIANDQKRKHILAANELGYFR